VQELHRLDRREVALPTIELTLGPSRRAAVMAAEEKRKARRVIAYSMRNV